MPASNQLYTVGIWTVRQGAEKEFIAEWEAFARWTAVTQPGTGKGTLLQDRTDPQQFISFGPWESMEQIKAWRDSPEFIAFAAKARLLCTDFQPRTLMLAATSDAAGESFISGGRSYSG